MSTRSDGSRASGQLLKHAHPEYPLEQLASSRSTSFQRGFARMTMHLLPAFDDSAFEASDKGLVILAASELALASAAEVLRQIHADEVHIAAPQVRLLYGDVVEEPIMWVRAAVPYESAEAVVHDLVDRDAKIEEVDWLAPAAVVRARAPLRKLLGYPGALAALCEGKSDLQMWLSHYAPVAPVPPTPGKAA